MIKTTAMLLEELKNYASPKAKLSRMARKGECILITRGLYETDRSVPAYLLAGSIYGPSYISFEYALSMYGLIPEIVHTVTCACFGKKKMKQYNTPFGSFTYRDVPPEAFPLSLELKNEGEYWYRIATAEKALCDLLYTVQPVRNRKELTALLYDDLRMEEAVLRALDVALISELAENYHSTNVQKLSLYLRRLSK